MRLYALGAVNGFGISKHRQNHNAIIQPRLDSISRDEISLDELLEWGEMIVKPKAEIAFKGERI